MDGNRQDSQGAALREISDIGTGGWGWWLGAPSQNRGRRRHFFWPRSGDFFGTRVWCGQNCNNAQGRAPAYIRPHGERRLHAAAATALNGTCASKTPDHVRMASAPYHAATPLPLHFCPSAPTPLAPRCLQLANRVAEQELLVCLLSDC